MTLLPGWWDALALDARQGTQVSGGPFWSGRFYCGQPLFGAVELPFSSPAASLALAQGGALWLLFHALVLSVGLALWLRRSSAGLAPGASAALALLLSACLLSHPESAALVGAWAWLPWAVVLSGEGAGALAAPFCALLASAAAPYVLLLALFASGVRSRISRGWLLAWGLGLLLAAPVLLEQLRQFPYQAMVGHPGWSLAGLGSPLQAFQAGLAGLLLAVASLPRLRPRLGLVFGFAAGALALAPGLFDARVVPAAPAGAYPRGFCRHQALPGTLPLSAEALEAERWTGSPRILGTRDSVNRWNGISEMGVRDPDSLSLADVGWVDSEGAAGVRWYRPVAEAVAEGALSYDVGPPPPDLGLFDRPLRVYAGNLGRALGTAWHVLELSSPGPGTYLAQLPPLRAAAWLFVSESFDAGWTCVQAGPGGPAREGRILACERGFMAVPVDPQDASVRLQYRPPRLLLGIWLSAAALLVLGAIFKESLTR